MSIPSSGRGSSSAISGRCVWWDQGMKREGLAAKPRTVALKTVFARFLCGR